MYTITYKGAPAIWTVAHGKIAAIGHLDGFAAINKVKAFYGETAQAYEFESFAWFLRFVDAYLGTGTKYFDAGGAVRDIYS
ncbi:MAG: hypothetical protein LBG45_07760 [Dysgonamonadaceae bacterium]|nr:hypothetical protein [Dysgonamonadaceae bacterium]